MTAILANAQLVDRMIYYAVTSTGAALLAIWLLRTSLGRKALEGSKPRRQRMPLIMPPIALLVWILGAQVVSDAMGWITGPLHGEQASIRDSLAYIIGSLPFIAFILLLGHFFFARGIKGLGLRLRTIPKALGQAFLCLLAVLPLVMAVLAVVEFIGRLTQGQTYQIPQHEKLKELTGLPGPLVRTLLAVTAVVVAPIQEEMLFRGLFQTFLRSYLSSAWLAIAISAAMFATVHLDQSHWPALFVLAMAMGYSYEKSGSLWQPVFIHALFNGTAILSALTGN
jgi:membrane protease YdiL (CAAX protease family)